MPLLSDIDEKALAARLPASIAVADNAAEVMIGGGAEIYRETMPIAVRLYITHVGLAPEGDTRFPVIDPEVWQVEAQPAVLRTERDSADFRVTIYRRRDRSAR